MPTTTRSAQLLAKRHHNELEESRAARALLYLLQGWDGALLVNHTQIDADYRGRIRAATAKVRWALEAGTTAHDALLEHIAPLFEADPKRRVRAGYDDEGAL